MLYRPSSEHSRVVEDFARDFTREHREANLKLVDLNTRDGSSTASLYDVMQYPAILALTDDGQLVREWEGQSLPLMNEVAYYAHQ